MTLQSLLERRVSRSALRRGVSDSGTRATDWLRYLDDSECRVLGGIDPPGSTSGVGEGSVFLRSVVADGMRFDEPAFEADLHAVADDRDLDLAAAIGVAHAIGPAGEPDRARTVDLARDDDARWPRPARTSQHE